MSSAQDYVNLVTSEHIRQPNFIAMIQAVVGLPVQVQTLLTSMLDLFDIDLEPVGDQLDIIGQWVGVSRNLNVPISGVFFSWGGSASVGWDYGTWQDPSNPTSISVLPDDAYLVLIRARIAANHWDGTTEGAYKIWSLLFPNLQLLIQDNQNMSFAVGVQGSVPDSLTLALLTGGYLPLKPAGIRISEYLIPADSNPLFGWDIDTACVNGWNGASWASSVAPT